MTSACAAGVNIFQFTFIEPFFSRYMFDDFNVPEKYVGLIFMALSFGYLLSCQSVHFGGKFV